MKPSVYIETSIPSFYFEVRTEPEMVARREWTRQWWDNHFRDYDVVTSVAVVDELATGSFDAKRMPLASLLSSLYSTSMSLSPTR